MYVYNIISTYTYVFVNSSINSIICFLDLVVSLNKLYLLASIVIEFWHCCHC